MLKGKSVGLAADRISLKLLYHVLPLKSREDVVKIENNGKKKMGRPTADPKKLCTRIRLSEADIKMLEYCSGKCGKPKSEIIRQGIRKIYDEIKE